MRFIIVVLASVAMAGCSSSTSDGDAGPAGACGPMPMNGFPVCSACAICGPVMDSMGRRGCTDGNTRGCIDCTSGHWVMRTITGCFDDTGVPPDAAQSDAFVSIDAGSDAQPTTDAASAIDVGSDATSDAGPDTN